MIAPEIIAQLKAVLGEAGLSEDAAEIAPHLREWRGKYQGVSALLLKPSSTQEVSQILAICHAANTPIVPQGGNTGLAGGQIPFAGEAILSLERMRAIRAADPAGLSLIADAGVPLAAVQMAAEAAGGYFPLSLASEGSCTIGGNLSTNAGGVNVLRYGNAREQVLGLEVVLADGTVLDLLRTLRKDNTGYDLKQLFIGAEGTLGIITAAALRLLPRPQRIVTVFAGLGTARDAVTLLGRMQAASGGLLSAFELIPRIGLEFVTAHMPDCAAPLAAPHPWYVLAEAQCAADLPLRAALEAALADALGAGLITDAVLAQSGAQRAALWRLRENISEAQKFEGGSIKHDVSVPIARIAEFLDRASAAVMTLVPGVRPVAFGHLGDGNIHFNLSVPEGGDSAAFLARWEEISRVVHDIVAQFDGSISAEHGLGVMKADEITRYKSAAEIETMRLLKRTLDPKNILNPGKVVRV